MATRPYDSSVFINCPFDEDYAQIFEALIFTTFDCGFVPRCAFEVDNGVQNRIDKIVDLIRSCRLGIHDLSRTELDTHNRLPRFNMPFELGLFLGAQCFGTAAQKKKSCLILDVERYRFQAFISDIAGRDIKAHGGTVDRAVACVRDWLASQSELRIPGGGAISRRLRRFTSDYPSLLLAQSIDPREATYHDLVTSMRDWLAANPASHRVPSV